MLRDNELIVLIGAGCSVDAGIRSSEKMIEALEDLMEDGKDLEKFRTLYNFIKSAILFADGIHGVFNQNIDIEKLMNVLNELEKKEKCTLFPFIGSWNTRLTELAGEEFEKIKRLKSKIYDLLKEWLVLEDYKKADYYGKFYNLADDYNYPLRVFSLNYDLCLENNHPPDREKRDLERGFDASIRYWDWKRFEDKAEDAPTIYFYKLHGSVDWKRDIEKGDLFKEVQNPPHVDDLIFGTTYKMQYIDPYLFCAYEFRKYTLEAKVIMIIGYSFSDEHINGILFQALRENAERKVLIVSPDSDEIIVRQKELLAFRKSNNQVFYIKATAKIFLDDVSIKKVVSECGMTEQEEDDKGSI